MTTYSLTNRLALPVLPRINLRVLWVFAFLLVVSLLVFYVFQVNEKAKASLLVPVYQRKIVDLSRENKILKIYFSQANSSKNIDALVKKLNLEPIDRIHYIKTLGGVVVTK